MVFKYVENVIRQKVESTVGDILGTSGSFTTSTSTPGVTVPPGFRFIDGANADNALPFAIVNEDDPTEWEVGIYPRGSAGSNDNYDRGDGTGSMVLASSSFGGWVNFSAGKKSISVVDIGPRITDYRVEANDADGMTSMLQYQILENRQGAFGDNLPLIDPSHGMVGVGIRGESESGFQSTIRERVTYRKETTDSTLTTLATIKLDADSATLTNVKGRVMLYTGNNPGDGKVQTFNALAKYDSTNPDVVLIGTPTVSTEFEDAGLSAAVLSVALSGNDLVLQGTGLASENVYWLFDIDTLMMEI